MNTLIIANWKKHPTSEQEARELFSKTTQGVKDIQNVDVVVCPPYQYLALFSDEKIMLGAQDFQSEVKTFNVKYVLAGHSDMRKMGETNGGINKKIKSVFADNMIPILCAGEKEGENKEEVLEKQIVEGLKDIEETSNIIIAYEPVWAIGTGNNCSAEETKKSVEFIKSIVGKNVVVFVSLFIENKFTPKAGISKPRPQPESTSAEKDNSTGCPAFTLISSLS